MRGVPSTVGHSQRTVVGRNVKFTTEKADTDRLHKWLESLDPDDLGKYKM